jgi:putative endonuclease
MAARNTRSVGRKAEALAKDFLEAQGLQHVASNYRCRIGEIDLVMRHGSCLVFAEVRFRHENPYSSAAGTVDYLKRSKIIRTAAAFLARYPLYSNHSVRFDVVGLDRARGRTTINWVRDAFRPE